MKQADLTGQGYRHLGHFRNPAVVREGHNRAGRGMKKVAKVMGEFKRGTLRSSAGPKVKKRSQAIAIAMSEAGMSRKKKRKR